MDLQDVYNEQKELTGISKYRNEFTDNEYSMSAFIWIVNSKDELLVQLRSSLEDKPNTYGITGGAVNSGETSLEASIREIKEELGLDINKNQLIYIASERRKRKFFEYYLLQLDIDINDLVLQKEEVEKVEWISIEDYEKNISDALNFQLFKNIYLNILKNNV